MKQFFNTFFGKLSVVFLILLMLLGFSQVLITTSASSAYYREADQKLNLGLAADMAKELRPFLQDSINMAEVKHAIHYMMVYNPKVEIYLLDEQGHILAFFADPPKKVKAESVNLQPIHKFLNTKEEIPILGQDPRDPDVSKPFSAARIQIAGEGLGYIYIIIGSSLYDSAKAASIDRFITNTVLRGLGVSILFTGIIGLLLFFFLTKRIRKMNEVVKQYQEGDLEARIDVKTEDEIGQLGQSFNMMADRILANIDELKETDRLRRELIANVSHDLRSPLASIRGYLETIQMKDGRLNTKERQNYMDVILDTATSMEELVEQLFELSKLDARQKKPKKEPFSINDLVHEVVVKFKPIADQKHIELLANTPKFMPQVYGDIGMIERVLGNLVDNALCYTQADGKVTINVEQKGRNIVVSVTDNGSGIDEKEIAYIFDRFYRVEKSRDQSKGGTGLGLAIAKKIMEIHDSDLKVNSKINHGSTFYFNLNEWQS
ncbi:MAG: HAMP domain-containing protein [Caldithrix sp.]|nr:HAMP domain-containing protein [Caldithrix sp.]